MGWWQFVGMAMKLCRNGSIGCIDGWTFVDVGHDWCLLVVGSFSSQAKPSLSFSLETALSPASFSSSQATTLTFLICLPKSNTSAFLSLQKSILQRCVHRFCKAHGLDPAHDGSRQFQVGFSDSIQMTSKNERMALFQ